MVKKIVLFIVMIITSSPIAWATLTVSPLKINFTAGQHGYRDIFLKNKSKKGLYIEVTPMRILHPGMPNQLVESYEVENPYHFGLAVSRLYTYLPANSRRMIRVVPLIDKIKQDAIYSIRIVPLPGNPEPIMKRSKLVVTHMRVLVGYDILLFIRPANAQPKIILSRQGHRLTIKNQGNTNVLLYKGRQCQPNTHHCIKLPSKRLYAGNTWSLHLQYNAPVSFEQSWVGHKKSVNSH